MRESSLPDRYVSLWELLPAEWSQGEGSMVWMAIFQMARASEEMLSPSHVFDLDGVRFVALFGNVPYVTGPTMKWDTTAGTIVAKGEVAVMQSSKGAWLMALTPYSQSDPERTEAAVKHRIAACRGLASAVLGRNVAESLFCETIVDAKTSQFTSFSNILRNPLSFPPPAFNDNSVSILRELEARISQKSAAERTRIRLSLKWYSSALEDDGVDAFLKTWIALEVLAMPNTSDIAPLKQLIGAAYDLPSSQASTTYYVGWLNAIRGRIVHDGAITTMHNVVDRYLEAIFRDVLLAYLGIASPQFAAEVIRDFPVLPGLLREYAGIVERAG